MARPDHSPSPRATFSPAMPTAVLKRPPVTQEHPQLQGNLSSDELISLLKKKTEDSIEWRLECALVIRELRRRVKAGEMGPDVNWYVWARKNIELGKTQLKGHLRVANAANPREEAERLFALGLARVEKLEARFAHEIDIQKSARIDLQRFAKYGPIEKVMHINEIRCKMYS